MKISITFFDVITVRIRSQFVVWLTENIWQDTKGTDFLYSDLLVHEKKVEKNYLFKFNNDYLYIGLKFLSQSNGIYEISFMETKTTFIIYHWDQNDERTTKNCAITFMKCHEINATRNKVCIYMTILKYLFLILINRIRTKTNHWKPLCSLN